MGFAAVRLYTGRVLVQRTGRSVESVTIGEKAGFSSECHYISLCSFCSKTREMQEKAIEKLGLRSK